MTAKISKWVRSACVAVFLPAMLGGCFGIGDRSVATAEPVDLGSSVATADAQPPIRTVKRTRTAVADAGAAPAPATAEALPKPSEIFDFHPPGSKPDSWRQPFVIDPNDGPLAGYVRRMDAELAESNHQIGSAAPGARRPKGCPAATDAAASPGCGENDVAKRLAQ